MALVIRATTSTVPFPSARGHWKHFWNSTKPGKQNGCLYLLFWSNGFLSTVPSQGTINKTVITTDDLKPLPITGRATIPESYLDEMGHMNVMCL